MLRFLFVLLALGLAAPSASAQITFEPLPVASDEDAPESPVQGRPVRITLDQPAEAVQVVWRPNSAIPDTVALDAAGSSFVWTPSRAGVATIEAISGETIVSQNVSVRYAGYPATGIFVLIIAGTLLFGGAGFAMGKLLGGESPATYDDLMPDT